MLVVLFFVVEVLPAIASSSSWNPNPHAWGGEFGEWTDTPGASLTCLNEGGAFVSNNGWATWRGRGGGDGWKGKP